MNALIGLSPSSLRKAADLQEKILELQSELGQLLGDFVPTIIVEAPKAKKRKLSAAGLAAIRAGVKKRMAGQNGSARNGTPVTKAKRKMSTATKAAMSLAAKARWKKAKAAGKNSL
jgi:peptide deformylase